ncbi:MAG TPA: hypothetical protein VMH48_00560 [Methylomirabilota bacterium]|nr:hypothetical protein [Methylomirabilota bacterium]
MLSKKQIIKSMATIAKKLGRTPSLLEFVARAGVPKNRVFQFFPKWNDAVRAAGRDPCRLYKRPGDNELLKDWGEVVRKKRGLPTRRAYRLAGEYYPRTLERRFGGWPSVPQAFRKFAKSRREWADVVALLPAAVATEKLVSAMVSRGALHRVPPALVRASSKMGNHKTLKDRATYGNPIHLPGFLHEPVNELGVVLLFGMLAKDLGYMIERVQKSFPDCEAKRQIAPDRWQRVNIEFEFESKNFHEHGHSHNGCDVIVCWRHNWPACPKHIEVLELSSIIKSLAQPEK